MYRRTNVQVARPMAAVQRRRTLLWLLFLLATLCAVSPPSAFSALSTPPKSPSSLVGAGASSDESATVGEPASDPLEFAIARKSFKGLLGSDKTTLYKFRRFTSEEGLGTLDYMSPTSGDAVIRFVAKTAEGSIAPVEVASEEDLQKLDKVKNEQLSGMWRVNEHIAKEAFGVRSPDAVPAGIVQSFLAQYSEGASPELEMASYEDAEKLMALIRSGSRAGWIAFANKHAYGILDPKRLPAEVAQRCLSEYRPVPRDGKWTGMARPLAGKELVRKVLQRFLKRRPTKEDIAWTVEVEEAAGMGAPLFTATLTFAEAMRELMGPDLATLSFRGEASISKVKAKQSAALLALGALGAPEASEA